MFILICIIFIAIALAFVLPPFFQLRQNSEASGVREANIAVYRDQLRELAADKQNGIISQEQYEQDRAEVERRLLMDVPDAATEQATSKGTASTRNLGYALMLALPLAATLIYLPLGNQNARSDSKTAAAPPETAAPDTSATAGAGEMSRDRIAANVAALAKKLEQNPNDASGWAMLGRSYSQMQNFKEASAAFEKATSLTPNDANLLAEYAFALSEARGGSFEGQPTELLKKALKLDPKNEKVLVLAGNAAFKEKNYNQAIEYWGTLLKTLPADSEIKQMLTDRISEAKRLSKDAK